MRGLAGLLVGLIVIFAGAGGLLFPFSLHDANPRSVEGAVFVLMAAGIGMAGGAVTARIGTSAARPALLVLGAITAALGLFEVLEYGRDVGAFLALFVMPPCCALGGEVQRRTGRRRPPAADA